MMIQTDNMMIETKDPMELLTRKLDETESNLRKLERIESRGIISPRFKKYCEHLLCLYQLCEEIKTFRDRNEEDRFIISHVEARCQLDAISELYFGSCFRNKNLDDSYKELYFFAEKEYEELNKSILED